jgi:hypothetical protein
MHRRRAHLLLGLLLVVDLRLLLHPLHLRLLLLRLLLYLYKRL